MINRFNNIAKRNWPRDRCVCQIKTSYYKRYTTSIESDDKKENKSLHDILEEDNFWELPDSTPNKKPTKPTEEFTDFSTLLEILTKHNNNSSKSNSNNRHDGDKDNREETLIRESQEKEHGVLEALAEKMNQDFDKTSIATETEMETATAAEKRKKRAPTIIERQLLELVLKKKKIFKSTAPLPRSLMPAVYGKDTSMNNLSSSYSPSSSINERTKETKRGIMGNKKIQEQDEEVKIINDVSSTTTKQELLNLFTGFLNKYHPSQQQQQQKLQELFPTYYAKVIDTAIKHAYTEFGDPYLAIALFEQCKLLSTESYIQGCTNEVYTTVLKVRWDAWKDIYGMLDLMEEMALNGIAFNRASAMLVRKISDEMEGQVMTDDESAQVKIWSPDDIRSTQLMKMLVGKWLFR
ncbi:hypothetical protein BJ944DRAFT_260995 [Cunninghamella echinulata]|nr:hypothetical protein BJ944DRAFT_260995 [Cunninghamella echinulata]